MPRDGAWDERLSSHGIDAVLWYFTTREKITFIFKETINRRRITIVERLFPNQAGDEFRPVPEISQELQKRGIKDLWVTLEKEPKQSVISMEIDGITEIIKLTRP